MCILLNVWFCSINRSFLSVCSWNPYVLLHSDVLLLWFLLLWVCSWPELAPALGLLLGVPCHRVSTLSVLLLWFLVPIVCYSKNLWELLLWICSWVFPATVYSQCAPALVPRSNSVFLLWVCSRVFTSPLPLLLVCSCFSSRADNVLLIYVSPCSEFALGCSLPRCLYILLVCSCFSSLCYEYALNLCELLLWVCSLVFPATVPLLSVCSCFGSSFKKFATVKFFVSYCSGSALGCSLPPCLYSQFAPALVPHVMSVLLIFLSCCSGFALGCSLSWCLYSQCAPALVPCAMNMQLIYVSSCSRFALGCSLHRTSTLQCAPSTVTRVMSVLLICVISWSGFALECSPCHNASTQCAPAWFLVLWVCSLPVLSPALGFLLGVPWCDSSHS